MYKYVPSYIGKNMENVIYQFGYIQNIRLY